MSDNPSYPAPPPLPLPERWYVHKDGEVVGPVAVGYLQALLDRGEIGHQTMVAKVGAPSWTSLSETPELRNLAASGALPPVYAGFWMRLLAYLIDAVIIFAIAMMVAFIFGLGLALVVNNARGYSSQFWNVVGWIISFAVNIAYYTSFPAGPWQATLGKRICGIHIVRTNGEPVTASLAFGRYLGYFVSTITLGIGFLMVAWTDQKKALHDMLCGTRVVYGKR